MLTVLISLITLGLGIQIGYYARELKNIVNKILRRPIEVKQGPRVVVPHMTPTSGSAKVDSKGHVIMPKSPAQIQADRDAAFSRKVQ